MPRGRRRSAVVYVHGHIRVDPETSKQDCVDCSADFGESTRPITLEYHLPTPVPRPRLVAGLPISLVAESPAFNRLLKLLSPDY